MQGKLIVFEGTDGSGKATQSELLCQELTRRGVPYRKLTFPRYQEESSALVRLYLGGAFGQKPGDVNAYAAAAFYSVDRYASYKQDWGRRAGDRGPLYHLQRRSPDLQASAGAAAALCGLAL